MAQRTFPRSSQHHELVAADILRKHVVRTGRQVELPVPIEMIIERTYGLTIAYEAVVEPPGTIILGAIAPAQRRIVINTTHDDLHARIIGPERFTLAHELGHWVYDAEDPAQQAFDFAEPDGVQFCYHREDPGFGEDLRVREINANNLAAALLLPSDLLAAVDRDMILSDTRAFAARCGVSHQTLLIRLGTLKLA